MFGFLKKKISGFSEKLKGRAKKKEEEPKLLAEENKEQQEEIVQPKEEPKPIIETEKKDLVSKPKENVEKLEESEESAPEEKNLEKFDVEESEEDKDLAALGDLKKDIQEGKTEEPEKKEELVEDKKEIPKKNVTKVKEKIDDFEDELEEREELKEEVLEKDKDFVEEKTRNIEIKRVEDDKRELKSKVGVKGKLAGRLFGGVEIKESEVEDLLWELELSLLESDVEQDAAKELTEKIKERIVGKKVPAKNLDAFLNEQIKEILIEMMHTEKIDLIEKIKEKNGPYVILMLGPNGAGKTTHIAKLSKLYMDKGLKVIWAAGDTFRAAAIDQMEVHAERLGVRVVKHQYGADPAAVGFDAVEAAKAGGIDVVFIDSAGRQETNRNLMEELKKIERVVSPDLKIYVGEAYAGQSLLEQAKEFDDAIGIDGFILSKIDTDAKGGTTISLLYKIKKPIFYVGTGQEYDDLEEFTPEFILNRIL